GSLSQPISRVSTKNIMVTSRFSPTAGSASLTMFWERFSWVRTRAGPVVGPFVDSAMSVHHPSQQKPGNHSTQWRQTQVLHQRVWKKVPACHAEVLRSISPY